MKAFMEDVTCELCFEVRIGVFRKRQSKEYSQQKGSRAKVYAWIKKSVRKEERVQGVRRMGGMWEMRILGGWVRGGLSQEDG